MGYTSFLSKKELLSEIEEYYQVVDKVVLENAIYFVAYVPEKNVNAAFYVKIDNGRYKIMIEWEGPYNEMFPPELVKHLSPIENFPEWTKSYVKEWRTRNNIAI